MDKTGGTVGCGGPTPASKSVTVPPEVEVLKVTLSSEGEPSDNYTVQIGTNSWNWNENILPNWGALLDGTGSKTVYVRGNTWKNIHLKIYCGAYDRY